jgi:hypothetical protein
MASEDYRGDTVSPRAKQLVVGRIDLPKLGLHRTGTHTIGWSVGGTDAISASSQAVSALEPGEINN